MAIQQDSWLIYENTGLLEAHEPGLQDFTVTLEQYGNPVLDQHEVLIKFEITQYSSEQFVKEQGILIGKAGLNIVNTGGAKRIIFKSENEDGIILLGEVRVYNNPAQLSFIGPYVYCNACGFSGATLVTFSADNVTIAPGGLLSSFTDLNLLARTVNATGSINIANLEAKVNETFSFKELYGAGDVAVFSNWINPGIVKAMGSVRLQSHYSMTIDSLTKADLAVELLSKSYIFIGTRGIVGSLNSIKINSQSLSCIGVLHAKKSINITVIDSMNLGKPKEWQFLFDMPEARIFSQGSLVIEGPHHTSIPLLNITSSRINVVGDAVIRSKHTLLQRDGNYKIEKQIFSQDSYADRKWWYGFECYTEVLIGTMGSDRNY